MRPTRLLVVFIATAASTASLLGAACSSNNPQTKEADGTSEPTSTADPTTTSEGTSTTGGAATSDGPNVQTEITNPPPDGGVVMNNATPPGDGGKSDRLQGITDVVVASRDKFRACFDVWAKKNPQPKETAITWQIKLDPEGKLISSNFKADETDITDKGVETCMTEVTKALKFPASPSEKVTTYNHPFKFKPKS